MALERLRSAVCLCLLLFMCCGLVSAQSNSSDQFELNDSHFHLTNYIQEGTDIHDFLKIMGTKVGRVAIFGIPLQQEWSYQNSGDLAPTYYLQTDAPLYYYSFTDAYIAMAYRSLSKEERARFDPMITGFNPADMYAADHIRRVLETFPGVFSGIGEFSIHKEFVSAKVAGETASLLNPALDRILDFAQDGRACRAYTQRYGRAVREGRLATSLPEPDEGPFQEAPKHNHYLGSHRHGPGSSADKQSCRSAGRNPG